MVAAKPSSRGIRPDMVVETAARLALEATLAAVPRALTRAARTAERQAGPEAERVVHQLRVSSRRAAAAISGFSDVLPGKEAKRAARWLKKVRRAAGRGRDLDVLIAGIRGQTAAMPQQARRAAKTVLKRLERERKQALAAVVEAAGKYDRDRWKRLISKLEKRIDAGRVGEHTAGRFARRVVQQACDEVAAAGREDVGQIEHLHRLRIRLKALRYSVELFSGCADAALLKPLRQELVGIQDALGAASDAERLYEECQRVGGDEVEFAGLIELCRVNFERAHADAVAAWGDRSGAGLLARLAQAFNPAPVHAALQPLAAIEPKPQAELNGHARAAGRSKPGMRRIAAIDVGTNSIRLIVAEAGRDGSYRVLDDEKEITRLGRGIERTRKIDEDAIRHSAAAIARMKAIAQGYGAAEVRIVATAAAREASNGADLVRAIEGATGVGVEIISAEQEAMLAYRSAANAFDLRTQPAVVIDLGGGSTEVILSVGREAAGGAGVAAGASGGVGVGAGMIERVYTIPLGAVRLTERFGGPEAAGDERYREMRKYIKSVIRQNIGRSGVPVTPQIVIGTGGTFTTLAAMARCHGGGGGGSGSGGLFEGPVQGAEVTQAEVRHLLEQLRKQPVRERTHAPGLPADRADIIVAGMCVIDVLLKELKANRFRAHEGGIRDGLLLSMVGSARGEVEARGTRPPDAMKAVRRFARACGYEQDHSLHVAKLALQIFDQLGEPLQRELAQTGVDGARARQILEAAAVLHDIGYLINYTAHHKHAYHLIVHAELPGWTPTEVGVIANIARYHRCAEPKKKHEQFRALPKPMRRLVRVLAGVLRVADGLDRAHNQCVSSVGVRHGAADVFFDIEAAAEPSVDMWGAARKAALLEGAVGLKAHFQWIAAAARAEAPRPAAGRVAAAV